MPDTEAETQEELETKEELEAIGRELDDLRKLEAVDELERIAAEFSEDAAGRQPPGKHSVYLPHYAARVLAVVDMLSGREPRQAPPRDDRCRVERDGHHCELPKGHEHAHRSGWRAWSSQG